MKKLSAWIFAIVFATSVGGFSTSAMLPSTASAACAEPYVLTIPPWYKGLTNDDCSIKSPTDVGGLSSFIWAIAMNVVEILLNIVGYVAVGYIIYGGFKYLISAGEPAKIAIAKNSIQRAIIGLTISIASIAIVNLVTGVL